MKSESLIPFETAFNQLIEALMHQCQSHEHLVVRLVADAVGECATRNLA
jgi:hypothetical protein